MFSRSYNLYSDKQEYKYVELASQQVSILKEERRLLVCVCVETGSSAVGRELSITLMCCSIINTLTVDCSEPKSQNYMVDDGVSLDNRTALSCNYTSNVIQGYLLLMWSNSTKGSAMSSLSQGIST